MDALTASGRIVIRSTVREPYAGSRTSTAAIPSARCRHRRARRPLATGGGLHRGRGIGRRQRDHRGRERAKPMRIEIDLRVVLVHTTHGSVSVLGMRDASADSTQWHGGLHEGKVLDTRASGFVSRTTVRSRRPRLRKAVLRLLGVYAQKGPSARANREYGTVGAVDNRKWVSQLRCGAAALTSYSLSAAP